jgi:selenide,water dikinase
MKSNERHFAGGVAGAAEIDPAVLDLLFDPQTSGGLLAAVDPGAADQAAAAFAAAGVSAARVGTVGAKAGVHIRLQPSFRPALVI